ncbi:MAG TPA: alpha/beta fold hydrolase [Actinocatenispora sp.]
MREQIEHFGTDPALFGIRTPAAGVRRDATLVLANSGIVHRIGANRNTVALARHLAGEGFDTFRFDFSGIGDGADRTDGLSWERSSPLELCAAIAAARRASGTDRVVLYGNCGGAAKSFWAAQLDPTVRGLLLTNPPPHPADPEFGGEVEMSSHGNLLPDGVVPDPGADLIGLLDRGVRVLFLFAENDVGEQYFHARLADRVGPYLADERLTVARIPTTNHTLASEASRTRLLTQAERWMMTHFGETRGD